MRSELSRIFAAQRSERSEGGMVGKVVPMEDCLGRGLVGHFPHPRTHAVRLPNSRIQAPEATYSGALNHQTHDSRLSSYGLTDHWLVQGRRIYVLALPKSALYVHTMP